MAETSPRRAPQNHFGGARTMKHALLALALSCFCAPAFAAPSAPGRLEFEVLRQGQPFGRHTVTVSEVDGALVAESQAQLRANLGPVTVFRYEQTCRETWRGGALQDLDCTTQRNSRRTNVVASPGDGAMRVTGRGVETAFPLTALPSNWWSKPPASVREFINTETGGRMPVRITRMGRETYNGIAAERVRVQGTLTLDLWYDDAGRWVGCVFTTQGQRIEYRLVSPLSQAPR